MRPATQEAGWALGRPFAVLLEVTRCLVLGGCPEMVPECVGEDPDGAQGGGAHVMQVTLTVLTTAELGAGQRRAGN